MSEVVRIRGFMNNSGSVSTEGDSKFPTMLATFRSVGGDKPTRKAIRFDSPKEAFAAMNETALAMVADGWMVEGDYLVNGDTSVTFQIKPTAFNAWKVRNRNGLPK